MAFARLRDWIQTYEHPRPFDRGPEATRRVLPFVIIAYASGLTFFLPDTQFIEPWLIVGIAIMVALTIMIWAVPWERLPALWQPLVPLLWVFDTLIINSGTGGSSGFTVLLLLTAIWLAIYGMPYEQVLMLLVVATRLVLPILVQGIPTGTATTTSLWRSVILFTTVSGLISFTVNRFMWDLREERSSLQAILDTAVGGFVAADSDGRVIRWSARAEALFGWTSEEAEGRRLADFLIPERYRDSHTRGVERWAKTGHAEIFGQILTMAAIKKDGDEIPIQLSVSARHTAHGVLRANAFIYDATEIAERDAAVLRLNDQLGAQNRDLIAFTSVASHDMRSPLRTMAGFSELLKERYSDQLDETARDYLARITTGTTRLQTLIDDLLAYARVGRDAHTSPQDLNQVLDDLKALIDPKSRVTQVGELPRVMGTTAEVTQVLQNLIENALKYKRPDIDASVTVIGTDDGFIVADQGVGILPKYRKQIFEPFRRLHTRQEFAGTGLGLSVVARIIERMGASITVEDNQPYGTRFVVSFPADVIVDGPGKTH